jgi:hypothetical protein
MSQMTQGIFDQRVISVWGVTFPAEAFGGHLLASELCTSTLKAYGGIILQLEVNKMGLGGLQTVQ